MNELTTLHARAWSWWAAAFSGAARERPIASERARSARTALFCGLLLVASSLINMPQAMAFTTPAAGSFGFDVYDIVVNQILGGPIGFVGGVALIVWGGSQVMKNWMITILAIVAGTIIIRAGTLVTSLGVLI